MRKVVVNTTPLISLANVSQLDILKKLYDEIMVPPAVIDEIKSQPAKSIVSESKWIRVIPLSQEEDKGLFRAKLHSGEVEVMLLAKEQNADLVIMDDNAAKKTAKFMGLNVTGTLGVLIRAKSEGYIREVKPIIQAIIADGFYVDEKTVQYVLEEAGED